MYLKQQGKRFSRSLKGQSPEPNIKSLGNLIGIKNNAESDMNQHFVIQVNQAKILNRLVEIQALVQQQKIQRTKQKQILIKMIREMECKHSAIIYNSQIRYCKSPPKPDIFFSAIQNTKLNQKGYGLKKVASNTCLIQREKQKQNIFEQPSIKLDNSIILCTQDDDININSFSKDNPEKVMQIINKQFEETLKPWIKQNNTNNFKKIINNLIQDKTNKFQEIQQKFKNKIQSLEQQMRQINKSTNNINKKIEQNQISINPAHIQFTKIQKKLAQEVKKLNEKLIQIKQNQQIYNNQNENKISRIIQIYQAFKSPIQNQLKEICYTLNSQSQQINKMDNFNSLNHNIYSNKIHEIFQFLNNKFDCLEKQKQIVHNIQQQRIKNIEQQNLKNKNIEAQKQKERQTFYRYIEAKIEDKSDFLMIRLSKQVQQNCQKVENRIIETISRHISYVEQYLKRNLQKQDIIVRNYLLQYGNPHLQIQKNKYKTGVEFLTNFNFKS